MHQENGFNGSQQHHTLSTQDHSKTESSTSEELDPRIQIHLENLNTATDSINRLEIELDEARAKLKKTFDENILKIGKLSNKLKVSIEKSQPYYDALETTKRLQGETQKWAQRFDRACTCHRLAKEMVRQAEVSTAKGETFDLAWQDLLNKATIKVNEAEKERIFCESQHRHYSLAYAKAENDLALLYKHLKKHLNKSSQYFELKDKFNTLLKVEKQHIWRLEEQLLKLKLNYTETLHSLEQISEEIHERRKQSNACDSTSPSNPDENDKNVSSSASSRLFSKLPDVVDSTQR